MDCQVQAILYDITPILADLIAFIFENQSFRHSSNNLKFQFNMVPLLAENIF